MSIAHVPSSGIPKHVSGIFTYPHVIVGNDRLQDLFDEMVDHFRREASGIAMTTVQATLIERVASTFVRIKHAEENPGDMTPSQLRELNKQYSEFIKEFNALLIGNHEQQKANLMDAMADIIEEAIALIPDQATQRRVSMFIAQQFLKIGA